MGTGIAAGVAGTALQGKQLTSAKRAVTEEASRFAQKAQKVAPVKLQTKDTDEQLPDQQAPGYENLWRDRLALQPVPDAESMDAVPDIDPSADSGFHHIDIQA